jgi:hypothetical protein
VTYPGAGASYRHGIGNGQLTWNLNYVALPVGMKKSSGTGLLGQLVYRRDFERRGVSVAGGFFASLYATHRIIDRLKGGGVITRDLVLPYSLLFGFTILFIFFMKTSQIILF